MPVTVALLVLGAAISRELAAVTWQRCTELHFSKPVKISSKDAAERGGSDFCALMCKCWRRRFGLQQGLLAITLLTAEGRVSCTSLLRLSPSGSLQKAWRPPGNLFLAKYVKAQLKLRANGCFAQNLGAANFPCEE